MTAYTIQSTKILMGMLLTTDTFDDFLLEEASIETACTFTIDGHVNQSFYQDNQLPGSDLELRPWQELRSICFQLIKGKYAPCGFRFTLHLMPDKAQQFLADNGYDMQANQLKALLINIRFDGTHTTITTGTSYHTFVLSREADVLWDKYLSQFLFSKGIPFETI